MSWKKWRVWTNIAKISILIAIIGYTIAGCNSTNTSLILIDDSKKVAFVDANEPAPFRGVLITEGRHNYLLRCEDYVIQQGIRP